MLRKELKKLELNQLIKRFILNTEPKTIQYHLTDHGLTPKSIIKNPTYYGFELRKVISEKKTDNQILILNKSNAPIGEYLLITSNESLSIL